VTYIKDPHAGADGPMFFHQTTILGVFDGHVPSAEIDHFRADFAMQSVQSGLSGGDWRRRIGWQSAFLGHSTGASQDGLTKYGNTRIFMRSTMRKTVLLRGLGACLRRFMYGQVDRGRIQIR